jgi:hypothetical protein
MSTPTCKRLVLTRHICFLYFDSTCLFKTELEEHGFTLLYCYHSSLIDDNFVQEKKNLDLYKCKPGVSYIVLC